MRPPPPRPTAAPKPAPVPIPPQTTPTPGGYRTSEQLLPGIDPVVPTGYHLMV